METVLATGATGNVGAHVARELRARGAPVRAFVRDRERAAAMLPAGVELAVGDFEDPASLRQAMQGIGSVLLSSRNHPRQAEHEINVIDAARAAGARRIVKLSTIGAAAGSPCAFLDAHGRAEQRLAASGLPAVVLASGFYMSNLLTAADSVKQAGALFAPAAGARIAMIDPRDVAATAAIVLTEAGHEGLTYTLTGPAALTYADVADCLSSALGRPIAFVDVPDDAARTAIVESGAPEWFADNLVTLFGLLREGIAAELADGVRRVTGREPRGFAEFARDHAAAFANQARPPR